MTLIIGIAGGTGSGKTTVVERIISELGEKNVSVIQHDAYYRDRRDLPLHQREKINFDHPDALETELLIRHLEQLKTGVSVEIPAYDFSNHIRLEETKTVEPRPAILVEGILVLAERGLRDLMDVMVFVDTDADVRLARRLVRDLADRDRSLEGV
ncbi:MAG: uridine kinase, partial [Gemmatimonadota bacterium]|nr:uridine kinase [Gemmatimonadota bacterium]